jgi:hypothetical protein
LAKVTPGGSDPVTEYVYGGRPPVHPKLMLIGVPALPVGFAGPPEIESGAGLMVMLKSRVSVAPLASITRIVKLNVPTVVGVPVTNGPPGTKVSRPLLAVNVNGAVPPTTPIDAE